MVEHFGGKSSRKDHSSSRAATPALSIVVPTHERMDVPPEVLGAIQ